MTTRKIDHAYAGHYALNNLYYFVPGALCFGIMIYSIARSPLLAGAGLLGFLSCIAVGRCKDYRERRNYHCPDCSAHLPKGTYVKVDDREFLMFECRDCDVQWDTQTWIGD
jgi:hypothetical protein